MAKAKITTPLVKSTEAGENDVWISDTEITGYGLRVRPNGKKAYVFRYQVNGKRQFKVLGDCKIVTAAHARNAALKLAGQVADDKDPVAERKEALRVKDAMISVADFCDTYLEDARQGLVTYRKRPKKASTIAVDVGRIEHHIKPIIGDYKLSEVTGKEVSRLYDAVLTGETAVDVKTGPRGRAIVTGGPTAANRVVGLLGGILSYARKKHLVENNPVQGFERHADKERERVLTDEELKKVGAKTREIEIDAGSTKAEKVAAKVIRALLLSGCRIAEITTLEKGELDEQGSCLRLGDTKTGRQVRPLGKAAIEELKKAPGFDDDDTIYLYPATRGDGPVQAVPKVWGKIRQELGIMDASPHSFRHTFGTIAGDSLGYSERTTDGLLGHAFKKGKYVHTADRSLVMAADRVSAEIARRMGEESQATVVQLRN